MRLMLSIPRANSTCMILVLFVLGGCSSAGKTLTGFVPTSIANDRANAEIRQAALKDDSFPNASEPPKQK